MSWKDDLKDLKELVTLQGAQIRLTTGHLALCLKRLTDLRATIDQMQKSQSRAVDRMADRMIELAMVNQGDSRAAAGHRRSLNEDDHPADTNDLWKNAGDDWPPPGCDAVSMP